MNYEIKNENILYKKILNANLFAGLFEQDFESSFEHPTHSRQAKKIIILKINTIRKNQGKVCYLSS